MSIPENAAKTSQLDFRENEVFQCFTDLSITPRRLVRQLYSFRESCLLVGYYILFIIIAHDSNTEETEDEPRLTFITVNLDR